MKEGRRRKGRGKKKVTHRGHRWLFQGNLSEIRRPARLRGRVRGGGGGKRSLLISLPFFGSRYLDAFARGRGRGEKGGKRESLTTTAKMTIAQCPLSGADKEKKKEKGGGGGGIRPFHFCGGTCL